MGSEQVSVARLIDRAWGDFDMRLTSIRALYVVWGSLNGVDDLVQRFCVAKGEADLLDKRRRRTEQQEDRFYDIQNRAESAVRYFEWARSNEGQPILQDTLVAYVSAFENALKAVAVAFRIAALPEPRQKLHFISNQNFRKVIKDVQDVWRGKARRGLEEPTAQSFYQSEIYAKTPDNLPYQFEPSTSEVAPQNLLSPIKHWSQIGEAFYLRNAVVHSNGRLSKQVELGGEIFWPHDNLRLTTNTLTAVEGCLRRVLAPIDPNPL